MLRSASSAAEVRIASGRQFYGMPYTTCEHGTQLECDSSLPCPRPVSSRPLLTHPPTGATILFCVHVLIFTILMNRCEYAWGARRLGRLSAVHATVAVTTTTSKQDKGILLRRAHTDTRKLARKVSQGDERPKETLSGAMFFTTAPSIAVKNTALRHIMSSTLLRVLLKTVVESILVRRYFSYFLPSLLLNGQYQFIAKRKFTFLGGAPYNARVRGSGTSILLLFERERKGREVSVDDLSSEIVSQPIGKPANKPACRLNNQKNEDRPIE